MDNEIRSKLADAFDNVLHFKGVSAKTNNEYIKLDTEDVEVAISCNQYLDEHMAVYVIGKMIYEGKIKFSESFEGERSLDDDIKYLKKLLKIGDGNEVE